MMRYISFILLLGLILGCTNVRDNIEKYNIEKLAESSINKKYNIPRTKILVGNINNYSRFGTQRSFESAKKILISTLKKDKSYIVIEDRNSTEFIENIIFSEAKSLDFIYLKKKYLDIDFIILGNILNYKLNNDNRQSNIFNTGIEKANIEIELMVIDVNTGKIYQKIGKGVTTLTYKISNISYGELEDITIEKAIRDGVEKLTKEIQNLPWSASIIKKEGDKLYIKAYPNKIFKNKTEFKVYSQSDLISYRNNTLGYEEEFVGNAKVISHENSNIIILKYQGVDFLMPAVVKLK